MKLSQFTAVRYLKLVNIKSAYKVCVHFKTTIYNYRKKLPPSTIVEALIQHKRINVLTDVRITFDFHGSFEYTFGFHFELTDSNTVK